MSAPGRQLKQKVAKIITTLRMKRRDVTSNYQVIGRKLMRSFELDTKEKIIQNAENHFTIKQQHDIVQKAVILADRINGSIADFVKDDFGENEAVIQAYNELCSMKSILNLPELDSLTTEKAPKEAIAQIEIASITDKEVGPYIKKFAEMKGSTQGMAERLQTLFPPPKAKTVAFAGRKQEIEE